MSVISHIASDQFRRNRERLGWAVVWFALGALVGIGGAYWILA